jgi:dihydroorotase
LPLNNAEVTLERAEQLVPGEVEGLVPFHAGETLGWRLAGG